MRNLKALNIEKSISGAKLVFEENWLDKLDRLAIYLICIWGFILPFAVFFDPNRDRNKTGNEYYLFFFMSIFCIYILYRKAKETRLTEILGNSSQDKNKELVNNYCFDLGFDRVRNSKNLIIFNSDKTFGLGSNYHVSRIFIFKENRVYFTVIQDSYRSNVPVLFTQFILKKDLEKLFGEKR